MNSSPKIWQLIIALCVIVFVFQFTLIINLLSLGISYLIFLLSDFQKAKALFDFELIDYLFACFSLIILPVYLVLRGRKHLIFKTRLSFTASILVTLSFLFIFAPLVTNTHPDFQKNIGLTKLLPPLSSVMYIKLEKKQENNQSQLQGFLLKKSLAVKSSFDESIFFVDSARIGKIIHYFQKEKRFEISNDSLKNLGTVPSLHERTFLLGSDEYGRDILSRLVYGARISVLVGISSVLLSFFIGITLGFVSGYFSGITDLILNRLTDTFLAFPSIFLIIIILALFGNSMFSVIIVLGFSGWMSLFKIVRSEVVSIKQKDYFISAEMIGLSLKQLLIKEILPILLTPIAVNLVFQFGYVILAEAALSYLGLGTGSNHPSWGSMIEAGQNYLKNAWWMIFFPGAALILTLYSANDLGQKIRVYFNPQLQK